MSTIAEKLKTTYLGLAGLTTSIRQLLFVGAKEVTSQEILEEVKNIDIDTTELAKQTTLEAVSEKIGTPAQGQGADLFAAMRDIALSATTLQELADAWSDMVTNRQDLSGFVFASSFNVLGVGDLYFNRTYVREIHDRTTTSIPSTVQSLTANTVSVLRMDAMKSTGVNQAFRSFNAREVYLPAFETINQNYMFAQMLNLRILYLPSVTSFPNSNNTFFEDLNLIDLTLGRIGSSFSMLSWSPTNALDTNSQELLTDEDIAAGFTSNLQKLLYNIREHIAANIAVAQKTITFSPEVKAAILADQETADAFTNKGWTIA